MSVNLKRKRRGTDGAPSKRVQKAVAGEAVGKSYVNRVGQQGDDVHKNSGEDTEAKLHDEDEGGEPENPQKHSSKLPSASELQAINEARNLYKNNTFKAQLDLLLQNIRPKESYIPPLERTLQRLYTHLTSLPSMSPVHPLDAEDALPSWILNKEKGHQSEPNSFPVAIPYPHPLPSQSTAWRVAFEPPETINVVGSWPDKLAVQKNDGAPFGVDVVVEMPANLFQEKDYLNSRFFHKRAFYLACIAASLARPSFNFTVEYVATEGDLRLTTLLLSSRKDGTERDFSDLNATIRIIPVLSDEAPIPLRRLSPAQSNIRGTVTPSGADGQQKEQSQAESLPTPIYNNTLALSFARTSRTRLIGAHKLVGIAPSFVEALALLRVWANQRGFAAGFVPGRGTGKRNYCVRGFEGLGAWWACVLEVLILGEEPVKETGSNEGKKKDHRPLVGRGLSSYQLFRAALDFLARHDFEREAIFMKVVEYGQNFSPTEWKAQHEAVFVDSTGMVNMLAGVPACSLQLLRYDAVSTLKLLNGSNDSFAAVFLTDMREPHARFDTVIRVSLANIRHHASLDFPSVQAATLHSLVLTVRKALSIRAHAVVPLQLRSLPHPIATAQPIPNPTLTLGIIFDPIHAPRLVDHGPPASSAEVDAFRAFWGPKAELRRFKDGTIVESCVWDEGIVRVEDREGVPARIVLYILNFHFGVPEEDVCVLAGDYGNAVSAPTMRGRGESGYKNGLAAFDKLVKELKALEDDGYLPLMLNSAKPCSPYLRYTSVFPPSPILSSSKSIHPCTSHLPAFEIALQFERSSQWPDDLRAIQQIKLALFENMARGLNRRKGDVYRASVVIDQSGSEVQDRCTLEVVLDGWAFHARVGHDREVTLLQDMVVGRGKGPDQPMLSAEERQAATHALHVHRQRFIHAPAHHSAVIALHHKLSAFAHTVRLVKRWLGAHWLSARVTEEAVELVCAQVFLFRDGDVPACGKRGFVRVMEFLVGWDGFAYVPLYEAVREVNTAVTEEHAIEPGKGSWRLSTAEDASGTMWCENVTIPVAIRVRDLAKATVLCLEEGTQTFKPLFEHPTTDYDFLIELDMFAVSRYWQGMGATPSVWNPAGYANLAYIADDGAVRVEFNPAELFFRDLQRVYGDTMELFYDIHGGTMIGGVWNPSVTRSEQHPWRVFLGFSSMPLKPGTQSKKVTPGLSFNVESVLLEVWRMGEGIVKTITTRE